MHDPAVVLSMFLESFWVKWICRFFCLTMPHFCACPNPGSGFPSSYVVVFLCLGSRDEGRYFVLLIATSGYIACSGEPLVVVWGTSVSVNGAIQYLNLLWKISWHIWTFFLQYINRKDLETQEYQPMRFQNIWITTLVIILDFKNQHFFFEIVPIWNQHNSRNNSI